MHFIRRFRRCPVCTRQDEINLLMTISVIYVIEIVLLNVHAINLLWIHNDVLFFTLSHGPTISILVALLKTLGTEYRYNSQHQNWCWITSSYAMFTGILLVCNFKSKLTFSVPIIAIFLVLHTIALLLHRRHVINLFQKDVDNNNSYLVYLRP